MTDRDAARALLRELLPELLGEALGATRANGNGHQPAPPANDATPQVPAPPTAAVLRPSTWACPAAPGEVIGDGRPPDAGEAPRPATSPPPESRPAASGRGARESLQERAAPAASPRGRVETVVIASDEDLDAFVRELLARFENPRDRMAIRAGHLRFALRRANDAGAGGEALRVERGAVTERTVERAAAAGGRIVLAPGAVVTPLAREKARALNVEIERERRC